MRDPLLSRRLIRLGIFVALLLLGVFMWRELVPSGELRQEVLSPGAGEIYRYSYGIHVFGTVLNITTTMLSSLGLLIALAAGIAAIVYSVYLLYRIFKWIGMPEDERLRIRWRYREAQAIRKGLVEKALDVVDILGDGTSFKTTVDGKTYEVKKVMSEYLKDFFSVHVIADNGLVFRGDMEKHPDYFLGHDCNYAIKKYVLGEWEAVLNRLAQEAVHQREHWRESEREEAEKKQVEELKNKLGEK